MPEMSNNGTQSQENTKKRLQCPKCKTTNTTEIIRTPKGRQELKHYYYTKCHKCQFTGIIKK